MQKKKAAAAKSRYVQSGLPGHSAPGGRRSSKARKIVQYTVALCLGLMVLLLLLYGIISMVSGGTRPVRLAASVTDTIRPFGENVLYYDGMTLTCAGPDGNIRWRFMLGSGANFYCTDAMAVAWSGDQLYVFDKNGSSTYNDRMPGTVRFARVGETYVAACIGGEREGAIRVMTHTGTILEDLPYTDLYVMDLGFFSSKEQLLWVLSLDVEGNAPISHLETYEPGRMSTGAVDLDSTLVYRVYPHNNFLLLADTTKIRAYNYKCVEQVDIDPILVYGWYVGQTRAVGKNTYALLTQMPSLGGAPSSPELCLVNNYTVQNLRLLSPCFASGLSEKGVYGFGENVIYYAPYGVNTFKATYLTYTLSDLVCMLDGGRAVLVSGDAVFILKLPT